MTETNSPSPGLSDEAIQLLALKLALLESDSEPALPGQLRSAIAELIAHRASRPAQSVGQPFTHGRHPWCQPGDVPHRRWMLRFADPDRRTMYWDDENAEQHARAAWDRLAGSWSCDLYCVAEQERPAQSVGEELDKAEKAHTAYCEACFAMGEPADSRMAMRAALAALRPTSREGEA